MPGAKQITLEKAAMAVEAVEGLGYSQRNAAQLTGVSQPSISAILSDKHRWGEMLDGPVFNQLRLQQKKSFQVASFELGRKALIRAEKSLDKASFLQSVTGYAILRDKERLDAGEPTEITATLNLNATVNLDKLCDALSHALVDSNTVTINGDNDKSGT